MKRGPFGFRPAIADCELELLIDLVERAQQQYQRPVTSGEVLSVVRTNELALLPQSSRGIARRLDVASYRAGAFGRTIRKARRSNAAEWACWHQSDHLLWANESAIKAQIEALQAELKRRADEERAAPPLPNPTFLPFAQEA